MPDLQSGSFPVLSNASVTVLVRRYLLRRSQPPTPGELATVAGRLLDCLNLEPRFEPQVAAVFALASTISHIEAHTVNQPKPKPLRNLLTGAVAEVAAQRLPLSAGHLAELRALAEGYGRLPDDDSRSWYAPKAAQLHNAYDRRMRWVSLVTGFMPESEMEELAGPGLPDDGDVDELAAALMELRRYGVKSCFMQDGLIQPASDAWVLMDGAEFREARARRGAEPTGHLAEIFLAPAKAICDFKLVESRRLGEGQGRGYNTSFARRLSAGLTFDGHLDGGDITFQPVAGYFEEAGRAEYYPLMRVIQLLRLYDLVVPAEVVAELPSSAQLVQPGPRRRRNRPPARSIRDLWLPRLHLVRDDMADVTTDLVREVADAERDTPDTPEAAATRARHEVLGFMRPLPAGRDASPSAHVLAWEQRKMLIPPGHTYVKTHNRGSGPPIEGHRARRRKT